MSGKLLGDLFGSVMSNAVEALLLVVRSWLRCFPQGIHTICFLTPTMECSLPQELPSVLSVQSQYQPPLTEQHKRQPLWLAGANVWERLFSGASGCCVVGRCQTVVIHF